MKLIYIFTIAITLIVGGFFLFSYQPNTDLSSNSNLQDTKLDSLENTEIPNVEEIPDSPNNQELNWREIELTDVRSGEKFTISQFDKPVLLESFAVWCPTCTKQQKEIKKLHEDIGDQVISISINTDENEDAQQVLKHINNHDFNWRYAISPYELTNSLIDEFGIRIVNAPSAPVILIDKDKVARQLPNGVKSSNELKTELNL